MGFQGRLEQLCGWRLVRKAFLSILRNRFWEILWRPCVELHGGAWDDGVEQIWHGL